MTERRGRLKRETGEEIDVMVSRGYRGITGGGGDPDTILICYAYKNKTAVNPPESAPGDYDNR